MRLQHSHAGVGHTWNEHLHVRAHHRPDAGRKTVLTAWQERKRTELRHAWVDERIPLGLVLYVQAQALARRMAPP